MKKYFRVFLGSGGEHIQECVEKGFIGIHYGFEKSLTPYLADTWSESRDLLKPIYLEFNPSKSPVGAGLSCGALWTFGKGMQRGDLIFCPDGNGNYFSGEITGDYQYVDNSFSLISGRSNGKKQLFLEAKCPRTLSGQLALL